MKVAGFVSAVLGLATLLPPQLLAQDLGSGQGQAEATPIPDDLALLQGKRVVVGRLALCVPSTFTPNPSYAGKTATVVGFRPNQSLNRVSVGMMPIGARAMVENLKKGGILVLQFDDGTKLDTCADMGSNQLSSNLELAPGEKVAIPQPASTPLAAPNGIPAVAASDVAQHCPLGVIKVSAGDSFGHMLVDALTTSELQRQIDQVNHGGVEKHYLDIKVRNDSDKPVKAFEFAAVYADKMGDESTSAAFISQNDKTIIPGSFYRASAMDRSLVMQNGTGDVTVYVARVRFSDDTLWSDNGSRSCSMKIPLK
jgi:hypothetical protein